MRNKLTAVAIKNAGDGKLQDGGGLYLIKKGGSGRWIYRYQLQKRRREMGLGSLADVSLGFGPKVELALPQKWSWLHLHLVELGFCRKIHPSRVRN